MAPKTMQEGKLLAKHFTVLCQIFTIVNVWLKIFVSRKQSNYFSIWIRADDAYFIEQIYTLLDLCVWFCAEKGFLSIDKETTVGSSVTGDNFCTDCVYVRLCVSVLMMCGCVLVRCSSERVQLCDLYLCGHKTCQYWSQVLNMTSFMVN